MSCRVVPCRQCRVACVCLFPQCVAKGSCFCLGGLGAGPCSFRFRDCGRERSRTTVLCPMRCALRIGLEGGRLGEALWRRAVVIAGESLSCRVVSCRVSCRVVSCRVVSCRVMCRVMSCRGQSRVPLDSSCDVAYGVMSCRVMSCDVMLSCQVVSCHVMSCHVK